MRNIIRVRRIIASERKYNILIHLKLNLKCKTILCIIQIVYTTQFRRVLRDYNFFFFFKSPLLFALRLLCCSVIKKKRLGKQLFG